VWLRWLPQKLAACFAPIPDPSSCLAHLNRFERRIYSQNGEDGIIEAIFKVIGTTNKFGVEFGVQTGLECNTRYLIERKGWDCLQMDSGSPLPPGIRQEWITAENIESLFRKYEVPGKFDLLSIDIDFNDYWVWKSLTGYQPRVVVIEYNASVPARESRVVQYDPLASWDGSSYFGASLLALRKLGQSKGYSLLACDSRGVNAFFVLADLLPPEVRDLDIESVYRPPRYQSQKRGQPGGHPPSARQMIEI